MPRVLRHRTEVDALSAEQMSETLGLDSSFDHASHLNAMDAVKRLDRFGLFCAGKSQSEAGFLTVSCCAVDDAGFGRLVKRRRNVAQGLGSFILVAGTQQPQVAPFERVQAGLDTAVMQAFSGAVAHAAFGGLGIGHKTNLIINRLRAATLTEGRALSMEILTRRSITSVGLSGDFKIFNLQFSIQAKSMRLQAQQYHFTVSKFIESSLWLRRLEISRPVGIDTGIGWRAHRRRRSVGSLARFNRK